MKNKLGYISSALTAFRAAIAPCLIWDARDGHISQWFLFAFVCGVVSDILDGEVLRRLKISNIRLRFLDSITDAVFYMSVLVCMSLTHPEIIQKYAVPISILLLTQTCSWVFSMIKNGKTTAYHTYIGKIWVGLLLVGTIEFFVSQYQFFIFSIIFGIFSNIEDMFITAIMPYWKCDILSIKVALDLRRTNKRSFVEA